ncbi:MAG: glycosyltransferase family 9 protein [Candidatus Omnitrophica bacterium]|jgi:ADP-heptose:LPS heptosyltransferase|nr:glycosyltransferase family 9 protein [Candidatus Omnitrophota bacterium]
MKYVFKNKLYLTTVFFIDLLGGILALPFKLFSRKKAVNVKRILLVRLDHIGDFVTTTPLFKNIKSHFSKAHLTVIINPAVFDLAKNNPYIDEIITFKASWFGRYASNLSMADFFKLIKRIRNGKFDIGIEPRGDFFSIILMFLGGVEYRIGYGVTGGGFLLNQEIKYNKNIHAIEKNLDVLRAMKVPIKNNFPQIYFSGPDKDFVETLLKNVKYNDKKAIVIHPYAGTQAKQWGESKFKQLIKELQADNYDIFIIGAKEDEESYDSVYDLRGKLNLPQLACLIKRIGFFIGLDSGPANIAATLDVPAVIICSGTNIAQNWIPNSSKVRFVLKETECKPCELKVCLKQKHFCMGDITVEEVMGEVSKF